MGKTHHVFFSRLGLILVGLQILLVVLIPLNIFPHFSCSFICIFSEEQGAFFLYNLPGMYITSIPFIHEFIKNLGTTQQRLRGEITLPLYIAMFFSSAVVYYLIGLGIETTLWKRISLHKNWRKLILLTIVSVFLALVLFIALAELSVQIANKVGSRIEQYQRCEDKNGFNTYQWETLKFEFYCKNGQYDGPYKVYENNLPDKEYTYKNGKMICENQYQCYKQLK